MEQVENKVCKEGDHVEVYCNVTAGIPDPAILWTNVTSGEHIEGNPLSITNITRAQAGEYRCTVNNTCGVDSIVVAIDVQCKNIDFLLRSFFVLILTRRLNVLISPLAMFMRATVIFGCAFELLL